MVSPSGTTKRKANKKGRGTPGRRSGRSASSSPNKKKQNKVTESEPKAGMDIDEIVGANGAEAAAAAKADNENVGDKQPDENTANTATKDKADEDMSKAKADEVATTPNEDEDMTTDKKDKDTKKDKANEGRTKGTEDAAAPPPSKVSPHAGDVQDLSAPPPLFVGRKKKNGQTDGRMARTPYFRLVASGIGFACI